MQKGMALPTTIHSDFNMAFHSQRKYICDTCYNFDSMTEEKNEIRKEQHEGH